MSLAYSDSSVRLSVRPIETTSAAILDNQWRPQANVATTLTDAYRRCFSTHPEFLIASEDTSSTDVASFSLPTVSLSKYSRLAELEKFLGAIDRPEMALAKEAKRCLSRLYAESMNSDRTKAIGFLFGTIEQAFSEQNPALITELLRYFDPELTPGMVAIGLLRATSRAKSKLPTWNACLVKTWQVLVKRHENAQHLLRGLIQPNDSNTFSARSSLF
jgi:hypothetical protein